MTPTTPTGRCIVARLEEYVRHWKAEADEDEMNAFTRLALRNRAEGVATVLAWLPAELARAEREAAEVLMA